MDQLIEFVGNHYMLSIAWIGVFLAIVISSIKGVISPVKRLNVQQMTMRINREDAVVIDIRSNAEFNNGHIAGAKNVTAEKIKQNDFMGLEKQKNKPIIVVCMAGMSASGVANQLLKAEFSDVGILEGGMNTWLGASLPVVKGKK